MKKSRLLGITVSSSKDRGAEEISKRLSIKSAVTVCSKCGMATGVVFMTLDQPKQVTALSPVKKNWKAVIGDKNIIARLIILTVCLTWLVQRQWGTICRLL